MCEKENQEKEQIDGLIDIKQFFETKLKVARVVSAERVPDTDKLMKLTVELGEERRTLVAGIAAYYTPEEMENKYIVVVSNLKPAKLRGITSQGMLLAAKDENGLSLLTVDKPVCSGSDVG